MSGPQGSEPNPWQVGGGQETPATPANPASGAGQSGAAPTWQQPGADAGAGWQPAGSEAPPWQPPAYTPQQYPQYGQPPMPGYPTGQPYGQPEYNPAAYGQPEYNPAAYGQPGQYPPPGPYGAPPQYGQYPPPPGQYPPPGQPGQYPYVPPGAEGAPKASSRALGTILGGLGALALLTVLLLGFWKPGFFVTTKLDVNKAQDGVQQILTDEANGYGAKNVQDVKCNNGQNPTVKKGDTFTCEVSIDGTKRQVTVTFQDDEGTYEVGRPK
jgi:hypothetical protein